MEDKAGSILHLHVNNWKSCYYEMNLRGLYISWSQRWYEREDRRLSEEILKIIFVKIWDKTTLCRKCRMVYRPKRRKTDELHHRGNSKPSVFKAHYLQSTIKLSANKTRSACVKGPFLYFQLLWRDPPTPTKQIYC